ncbi:MAG: Fic family protein, partial [bacterium]|nr:Fic family protein [bacterium]
MTRNTGSYETTAVAGEKIRAFIPASLPPSAPPLDLSSLEEALALALEALRLLDLAGSMVP